MNENRADNFLRLIRRSRRGRLKIYLGYAAGVGKTCQMLLEGQRLKEDGIDLVAGFVETHGQPETEALLAGLPLVPRRRVVYHGIEIMEMDQEAILSRHPGVVLIDELAHTNVPGSRNARRYQDVEELLAAGIHVISTLNIQHLESLYETVEQVSAVRVRERIPDRIVTEADQLVNVDITIEDLRRRLMEGKVYIREPVEVALDHFFRPDNLEQLRELTLRELAAQIDSRRRDPQGEEIPSSPDQVMVCLSSREPNSEALLRYASRLAGRLNRNWYVVYIQTFQEQPARIDGAAQRVIDNALTLAQQLGATVFTYKGDDIARTILQFAREYRVGHIVIGTPGRKVPFLKRLRGEVSIVERLITEGKGLTVVVPDTRVAADRHPAPEKTAPDDARQPGFLAGGESMMEKATPLPAMTALVWEGPIAKDEAIRELLDACPGVTDEWKSAARQAVLERERQGGTFVAEDVAVPHARIGEASRSMMAIGVGRQGIRDPESGWTFSIMALLISPVSPPESHLKMLGMISRMARDDQWRRDVLAAGRETDALRAVEKWGSARRTGERPDGAGPGSV